MAITALYAGLLGLVYLVLTMRVIRRRQTRGINLGDAGDVAMERRIRGHANFNEYVPFILIVMALLESGQASSKLLHSLGALTLVARVLHGYSFAFTEQWFLGRFYGALLTLIALALAALAALHMGLSGL